MSLTLKPAATGMSPEEAAFRKTFDEGVQAMGAKNHDAAIAKFNEAIGMRADCYACYMNVGSLHYEKKENDKAEAAFKKAHELKPDDARPVQMLADLYNSMGRREEAAAMATKAASMGAAAGGGSAQDSYNQGVILWNAGKIAEAKAQFEAAVKADPNYADANYWVGMAHLNGGNMAEAAEVLRELPEARAVGPHGRPGQGHPRLDQAEGVNTDALDTLVAGRLAAIRARIASAATRSGRPPEAVRLVAVSKTFGADAVRAAYAAGQVDFGENRVQEALAKRADTADLPLRWHLIGPLQSNKANKIPGAFAGVQSVHSLDLVERLSRAAVAAGSRPADPHPGRPGPRGHQVRTRRGRVATPAGPGPRVARRQGRGAHAPASVHRGPRAGSSVVPAAPRPARHAACRGHAARTTAGTLDGDVARLRGRHRGRRHHRSCGISHLRRKNLSTRHGLRTQGSESILRNAMLSKP